MLPEPVSTFKKPIGKCKLNENLQINQHCAVARRVSTWPSRHNVGISGGEARSCTVQVTPEDMQAAEEPVKSLSRETTCSC